MNLDNLDLSPELLEEAKACTTPEEVLAFAKKKGLKLSDEQIEAVSGGGWGIDDILKKAVPECPSCGSYEVAMSTIFGSPGAQQCRCSKCGYSWTKTPFS